MQTDTQPFQEVNQQTQGGYCATALLHSFTNLCTLISLCMYYHTSHVLPLHGKQADVLTIQIKTQTAGVTVGSRERGRVINREREGEEADREEEQM